MVAESFGAKSTADDILAGKNLSGKTIVVTGANTGIGYATARAFAASGARVIFACRNAANGNQAVANAMLQHPGCNAEFLALDLGSADSILSFCQTLDAEQVDILVCNAGLMATSYSEVDQATEATVGVSHFGHFLLTQTLMQKLLASGNPRVIMVSSTSHTMPKHLQFDRFPMQKHNFKSMVAYGQAKLCNVLMANELQRRYGDQGLSACALHPGTMVTTDIGRNSFAINLFMKIISPLTKTPNQGAATSVYCAVHEPAEEIQGCYFSSCKAVKSSAEANDPAVAAKLWALSEAWCQDAVQAVQNNH